MQRTVLLALPLMIAHRFPIRGQHPVRARCDQRGRDHRVAEVEGAFPVPALSTAWTGNLGRVKRVTIITIKSQGVVVALVATARQGALTLCGPANAPHLCKQGWQKPAILGQPISPRPWPITRMEFLRLPGSSRLSSP